MNTLDKELLRQVIKKRIETERDIDVQDFSPEFNNAIAKITQNYPEKEVEKEINKLMEELS